LAEFGKEFFSETEVVYSAVFTHFRRAIFISDDWRKIFWQFFPKLDQTRTACQGDPKWLCRNTWLSVQAVHASYCGVDNSEKKYFPTTLETFPDVFLLYSS
jgi:hypothetical protein